MGFFRYFPVFLVPVSLVTSAFAGGTTTDGQFLDYAPGVISSASLQKSGTAGIGLPVAVDDGQTTPFTPPFHASSITIIGGGGHLVLHFIEPVISTGRDIGIFTNTGLAAASSGGVITAGTGTLGQPDTAIVSVSTDDQTWFALNGGNPMDLTMPSNAFTDSTLTGTSAAGGVTPSNPFEPFTSPLSSFFGLTYPQIDTLLSGSWGGAWIDASAANFPINFIRFDVPVGDRLVLDAVTAADAVPEPGSLGLLALGVALGAWRRRGK
jgi:PEP-CTERM motif